LLKKVMRRFEQSLRDTKRLQRRYRRLSNGLGCLFLVVGCAAMGVWMRYTWVSFDLPLEGSPNFPPQFPGWLAVTIVSIPIILYLAMVFVAGSFGAIMVARGRFTRGEAIAFALYGNYPAYWLRPK